MSAAYDRIVAELTGKGFRVVIEPTDNLPDNPDETEKVLDEALGEAKLAVHLLGKELGPRIGVSRLVDLQLMKTFKQPISRIVWAPTVLFDDPTQPESRVRVHGRDPLEILGKDQYRDGDIVSGDTFETFLLDLIRRCEALRPAVAEPKRSWSGAGARAYVCGAVEDAALVDMATGTLIDHHGIDAFPCAFRGSPDELRRLHQEEMRESDGVLYCWGDASDYWLVFAAREARNHTSLGRDRPFRARALLRAPPFEGRKLSFRSSDLDLILPPADSVTPDILKPFVRALTD